MSRDKSVIVFVIGVVIVAASLARGNWAAAAAGVVLTVGGAWAVRHYGRRSIR